MEVALLLGLAALGYALAPPTPVEEKKDTRKDPKETFINPLNKAPVTENITIIQSSTGHNNMVPFFGANLTQSIYNGATDGILDTFTGTGKHTFFHKEESGALFKPEPATGLPWGRQVETDFEQSRMVSSMSMKNVFPIEPTQVGPGVNDGYTNLPSGGYQQDSMREFALPRTTDELRVASNPKLTYEGDVVPGAHYITEPGIQAPVKKNKPDRFAVLTGVERANTTTGQQMASAIYPTQVFKEQDRETTSVEYKGTAQAAGGGYLSYIRAFTEPFEQFMKLTVEGRPTPAGPAPAGGLTAGPQSYNVQTHRDESLLDNTRGFEAPLMTFGGQAPTADLQGSTKYVVPLKQDFYTERNDAGILDAFKKNPYTQSLQSSA